VSVVVAVGGTGVGVMVGGSGVGDGSRGLHPLTNDVPNNRAANLRKSLRETFFSQALSLILNSSRGFWLFIL
jgi:hypothetical protein